MRLRLLLSLAFALTVPLLAQRGDNRGEAQPEPIPPEKIPPAPILSPAEALQTFKLGVGLKIEAVATEPLVGDPVAAVFGPDGRLWVVEMRSYMQDVDGNGETDPIGKIVTLEDTDRDGRFDKRTVYLDNLVIPRAVALVDDGVIVGEPPQLWFTRDTNGDGVCDEKTAIANDYGARVGDIEHMASAPTWMMDNWIYSSRHPVRFRYEGAGKFGSERTISRGEWGLSQDDVGRIYYNSNSDTLRADFVPASYFLRNPHLTQPSGLNVSVASPRLPVYPARINPGINRGYKLLGPDGKLRTVTASCSPLIYRGTLLPEDIYGDAFICEPSGNLVKRIALKPRGTAIVGENAYENSEFLASTDERFRPVNLLTGPDGALYLVDMYRGVLQHKMSVTTYLRKQIKSRNLDEGRGLGRIYRITRDGAPPANYRSGLDRADTAELVRKLDERNGWIRDTAQRLLVEKRDPAAAPLLRARALQTGNTVARVHALWTLEGLGAIDRALVLALADDAAIEVAAAATRLTEKWLAMGDPAVLKRVADVVASRSDPTLRLQAALSFGEVKSSDGLHALRTLVPHALEPFMTDAIVSGLAGREPDFIAALLASSTADPAAAAVVARASSCVFARGTAAEIERVLALLVPGAAPASTQTAVLDGIQAFLPRRADGDKIFGRLPAEPKPLLALAARPDIEAGRRASALLKLVRWPGKPGVVTKTVTLTPAEEALFEKGRAQFTTLCAGCHQPNGQGMPGIAPSLVDSRWVSGPAPLLARIVLHGREANGLMMPGLRSALNDEAIAAALTFVRNSWGHAEGAVSPAAIAMVRAETAAREDPWRESELRTLLESMSPATTP